MAGGDGGSADGRRMSRRDFLKVAAAAAAGAALAACVPDKGGEGGSSGPQPGRPPEPPTGGPPIEGTPHPPDSEAIRLMKEWGIGPDDKDVVVVTTGAEQVDLKAGEVLVAGLSFIPPAGPERDAYCGDFWNHVGERHAGELGGLGVVKEFLGQVARGEVDPVKLGIVGEGTRVVAYYIVESLGRKFKLIWIIGRAVLPTVFQPDSASRVSDLFKGVSTVPAIGSKHKLSLAETARCLEEKVPVEVPVQVPEPVPVPTPELRAQMLPGDELRANGVYRGGLPELTNAQMAALIGLGIVLVVGIVVLTGGTSLPILAFAVAV